MTTNRDCIMIMRYGWKNLLRTLRRAPIDTTEPAKTTLTPISSDRSWVGKWSSPLQRANLISDHGNKSSTANSMGDGVNEFWLRYLETNYFRGVITRRRLLS